MVHRPDLAKRRQRAALTSTASVRLCTHHVESVVAVSYERAREQTRPNVLRDGPTGGSNGVLLAQMQGRRVNRKGCTSFGIKRQLRPWADRAEASVWMNWMVVKSRSCFGGCPSKPTRRVTITTVARKANIPIPSALFRVVPDTKDAACTVGSLSIILLEPYALGRRGRRTEGRGP